MSSAAVVIGAQRVNSPVACRPVAAIDVIAAHGKNRPSLKKNNLPFLCMWHKGSHFRGVDFCCYLPIGNLTCDLLTFKKIYYRIL